MKRYDIEKIEGAIGDYEDIVEKENGRFVRFEDAEDLLKALEGIFEHCAIVHKIWGSDSNQKQADAVIKAAQQAIAEAKGKQ